VEKQLYEINVKVEVSVFQDSQRNISFAETSEKTRFENTIKTEKKVYLGVLGD